jgi:glucose/arabinose dehydrogenase
VHVTVASGSAVVRVSARRDAYLMGWKLITALLVAAALSFPSAATAAVLPPDFTDSHVASVPIPTTLAFTPDGRLLVTSQSGALRVIEDGTLLSTPALDLSPRICSQSERGLLGIATDPAFAANHFIYLYYTAATPTCVNRVSRFVLSDDNVVNPASEDVLLDNIPSPGGNHNGGDLQFGKDGYLYVSVGDGGCDYDGDSGCGIDNAAARDLKALVGKVLRITSDGGVPPGNPFLGPNSARCNLTGRTDPGKTCQEIYAWGLRNPFRIPFDPNASGTRFYINDVGQDTWEEIDLGQAGADYGWNVREGFCAAGSSTDCGPPPVGMTNPIFAYHHANGCVAITGGAFVPNGVWSASYDGSYLFADYNCGTIFRLIPGGSGTFTATDFATGLGSGGPITMIFGPEGSTEALYYLTYANGGEVRRISSDAYPTPEGAASLAVSLVPAFKQCGTGGNPSNSSHPHGYGAPPGPIASCNPPKPASANARTGATGTGRATMSVVSGSTDLQLSVADSDIRTPTNADYDPTPRTAGQDLGASFRIRLTDLNNCTPNPCAGPYTGAASGTDLNFGPIPIDCVRNGNTGAPPGSGCNVSTSANAFTPDSVAAGRRAVWQVFRVRINDSAGNLFQQQGFFAP